MNQNYKYMIDSMIKASLGGYQEAIGVLRAQRDEAKSKEWKYFTELKTLQKQNRELEANYERFGQYIDELKTMNAELKAKLERHEPTITSAPAAKVGKNLREAFHE